MFWTMQNYFWTIQNYLLNFNANSILIRFISISVQKKNNDFIPKYVWYLILCYKILIYQNKKFFFSNLWNTLIYLFEEEIPITTYA